MCRALTIAFIVLKCECLPKLEGVSHFLRLTFDFQWQPGWISAIFHVAQSLMLTNRTGYSAGIAGNPWWWDLFMLLMHSFETVELSFCLGWAEQCYTGVNSDLCSWRHRAALSFSSPPHHQQAVCAASSIAIAIARFCWAPATIPLHSSFVYLS